MAWDDRIREAVLTSPNGNIFTFLYENVSIEIDKNTTEFTFPEKKGVYIQDLGRKGRRFPFNFFFSGPDYDQTADSFVDALDEVGVWKLEHPKYGDRIVVPTGTITRNDNLVTAANQASFQITFSETIEDLTFPISSESAANELATAGNNFQTESAEQFANDVKTTSASEAVALENTAKNSVPIISQLEAITEQDSKINNAFKTLSGVYENQIKNVVLEVGDTALQAVLLIRTPSKVITAIRNEIDIYKTMINQITAVIKNPDGTNDPVNEYYYNNLMASAGLSALCESPLSSEIETRGDAISASEEILNLYDNVKLFQDQNITSLGINDSGESYTALTEMVSKAVSYLINVSFDLPQERTEVLQNDRNLIEYLASVGLNVENNIDNFIQWNNLTGDEIEILPKGLEVRYYE